MAYSSKLKFDVVKTMNFHILDLSLLQVLIEAPNKPGLMKITTVCEWLAISDALIYAIKAFVYTLKVNNYSTFIYVDNYM